MHLLSIQTNGKIQQQQQQQNLKHFQVTFRIEIGGQLDIAYQVRPNINSN